MKSPALDLHIPFWLGLRSPLVWQRKVRQPSTARSAAQSLLPIDSSSCPEQLTEEGAKKPLTCPTAPLPETWAPSLPYFNTDTRELILMCTRSANQVMNISCSPEILTRNISQDWGEFLDSDTRLHKQALGS